MIIFQMKYITILVLIVLIFTQHNKKYSNNCQKYSYTYSNFVLTWPGDFCRQPGGKNCNNADWYKNWDGRTFSIHGWWPSSPDVGFVKCIQSGTDKNCDDPFQYQPSLLTTVNGLKQKLDSYWPDLTNNNFLSYEWNKHGVCYLHLLKRTNFFLMDNYIFIGYFKKAVNEYQNLVRRFQLSNDTYKNSEALFKALNIDLKYGYPSCRNQNGNSYLKEIYFCFSLPSTMPGDQILIECPKRNDNCNGVIHILSYRPIPVKPKNTDTKPDNKNNYTKPNQNSIIIDNIFIKPNQNNYTKPNKNKDTKDNVNNQKNSNENIDLQTDDHKINDSIKSNDDNNYNDKHYKYDL